MDVNFSFAALFKRSPELILSPSLQRSVFGHVTEGGTSREWGAAEHSFALRLRVISSFPSALTGPLIGELRTISRSVFRATILS